MLKNLYGTAFYVSVATALSKVLPAFDSVKFKSLIFNEQFQHMELKERMRHTTLVLHEFMPAQFTAAVPVIYKLINELRQMGRGEDELAFIFLPDYLEVYGIDDFQASVPALEFVTQFVSCEFAVRPFLIKYFDQMMEQMKLWSRHESAKVRRLATEGSRPRLPWAMAIPQLKKDPALILPILENLKNDPSESVRRSVANNLNDISKDNPEVVLLLAKEWLGHSKETDAIMKHGCRTLLKQGHADILSHYGLDTEGLLVTDFKMKTPLVMMGDAMAFSFSIQNTNTASKTIRLEYGLFYKKANGTLARKVFKISERIYKAGERVVIERKQSFRPITTRVFYPGEHQLSLIINGEEQKDTIKSFELLAKLLS
ncbi:3-methyladenine DNA glycosylase AlkC [Pedobacter sp. CAN_A7]|uniref:DNA alkylation repair protein n=1 Tax=Pedobacter sp. CAN_A7 TaxID=2787722 RepID=UPI0018C90B60